MDWIFEMIKPIIENCNTPQEARKAIIEWGKSQEPRDAACALIAIDMINARYGYVAETTDTQ